jgi:hypothetical protein
MLPSATASDCCESLRTVADGSIKTASAKPEPPLAVAPERLLTGA